MLAESIFHRPRFKKANRTNTSPGSWTREELKQMDDAALARMVAVHPKLCPAELRRKIVTALRSKNGPVEPKAPTQRSAEAILRDLFGALPADRKSKITIPPNSVAIAKRIKEEVAARHGVLATDLEMSWRGRRHANARQEAMYLVVRDTGLSYPRIAKLFGGCDHSTVIHAARAHAERNRLPRAREGSAN